jgi:hypothetical protein
VAIQFNPHKVSLGTLENMMELIARRVPNEGQETSITRQDVNRWNKFRDQLKQEKPADQSLREWIEQQDQGGWVPFQPGVLNRDGSVTMPERFERRPGDFVSLYDARPDPVFLEKAQLLIKFDSMLLAAAKSLEASLPKLVDLVRTEANDDYKLSNDEVEQIRSVIAAIEASTGSIADLMAYRQELAKELSKMDPQGHESSTPTDLMNQILNQVNELGNDYRYHSGWNPSHVLFHAKTLGNDEAAEFIGALKHCEASDDKKKAILKTMYENAGDRFAPLIINADGADNFTKYAAQLGMKDENGRPLQFETVADTRKSHPVG